MRLKAWHHVVEHAHGRVESCGESLDVSKSLLHGVELVEHVGVHVRRWIGDHLGQSREQWHQRPGERVQLLDQATDLAAHDLAHRAMKHFPTRYARSGLDASPRELALAVERDERVMHRIEPIASIRAVEQLGKVAAQLILELVGVHPRCGLRRRNRTNLIDDFGKVERFGWHGAGVYPWLFAWLCTTNVLAYDACVPISELDAVLDRLAERADAPDRATDPEGFLTWLAGSDADLGGPVPLSRMLAELRAGRPDLLDAYPQIPGMHTIEYREWARVFGAEQVPLPPAFVPAELPDTVEAYVQAGVNLAGFLTAELGVGEVARRLVGSLRAAHVPFATTTFARTANRTAVAFATDTAARFDTNIVCVNADSWGAFAQHVGPDFFAHRHTVAVWFWETSIFPSMFHAAFAGVDEVWVASEYVAGVLREVSPPDTPIVVFPLPIVVPDVAPGDVRARLGLPDERPFFLTSFDYNSVAERKNPCGAIAAFCAAFPDGDGPLMIVKSINGDRNPDAARRVAETIGLRTDIVIHDGYLDAAENMALLASALGLVSLHRAEGFGFNIADALALGVPVVATAYSGSLTFTSPDDCWHVPATERPVGPGQFPYLPEALWAEPDLACAAEQLRAIADDPVAARARAATARARVLDTFTPARCGEFVRNRLAATRAQREERAIAALAAVAATPAPPEAQWHRAARWAKALARRQSSTS